MRTFFVAYCGVVINGQGASAHGLGPESEDVSAIGDGRNNSIEAARRMRTKNEAVVTLGIVKTKLECGRPERHFDNKSRTHV